MGVKTKHEEEQIPFDLPVKKDIIFSSHKNVYKKRIERRQIGLLKKLPFLKTFLDPGEEIVLITTGCSPVSSVERFWTGLNVFELKCSFLVFTDKRVFHVPATKHYSYRDSIAHFYYADCISLRIKGLTVIAVYKNGRKDKFHHIAVREEKKLKVLLRSISLEGPSGRTQGRVHLCPRCTKELEEARFICGNCNLEFKDKATAKRLSIIYPGGGYFYARHPFLGLADAAIEIMLAGMFVLSLVCRLQGVRYSGWGLFIFPLALVFEKLLTIYHSNNLINEYIPKKKDIDQASCTRLQPD